MLRVSYLQFPGSECCKAGQVLHNPAKFLYHPADINSSPRSIVECANEFSSPTWLPVRVFFCDIHDTKTTGKTSRLTGYFLSDRAASDF